MTNLDLTLHGDTEEHDEVHHKDRPEHWHVEGFEERANHSDDDAFRRRMPESTNKTNIILGICSLNSLRFGQMPIPTQKPALPYCPTATNQGG